MTGKNKIWRLAVTIPMTVILALLGWFAAEYALRWYAGDPDYSSLITGDRAPTWVRTVIRFTYLAASGIFGIALGRLVFRWLEGVDERLQRMSSRDKLALLAGLFVGLSLSALVSLPIIFSIPSRLISTTVTLLVGVVVTFVTTAAALSLKEEVRLYYPPPAAPEESVPPRNYKILDTNVIIDGRIADVARAGFVEGTLYIPGFVLDELQHIADSADDLRRQRGKRGLEVLRLMKAEQELEVREYDRLAGEADAPVDSRLVRLAQAMGAAIITNDSNLNKVASLEGVNVLNVNELANALKPVVLVGEDLPITVVREGKEPSQGVGYLDDGTMVVIAGARRYVGQTIRAQVTSVTQSTVGKMIFAQVREDRGGVGDAPAAPDEEDGPPYDGEEDDPNGLANGTGSYEQRNMRPYSGRRARRPVR